MKSKQKNLIIIDGHNFLFKSYAVPFKFYSKKGTPLHVITTFISLVRRAIKSVEKFSECSDIALVFDSEKPSSNHKLLETYKTNRKKFSEDEDSPFKHLPQIKKVLKHLKIKTYEKMGVEADDLIASLASQYLKAHKLGKIFIISNDSDFYQLLSKNIKQIIFKNKGINLIFSPKELRQKHNIAPKQYIYFKCLTGDRSDNIKGIPNIGPIKASKIINKELKFNLKEYFDLINANKKLIELNCKINVCNNLERLSLNYKILNYKNSEIFSKLNF